MIVFIGEKSENDAETSGGSDAKDLAVNRYGALFGEVLAA
jgi:hypothetical protein